MNIRLILQFYLRIVYYATGESKVCNNVSSTKYRGFKDVVPPVVREKAVTEILFIH